MSGDLFSDDSFEDAMFGESGEGDQVMVYIKLCELHA